MRRTLRPAARAECPHRTPQQQNFILADPGHDQPSSSPMHDAGTVSGGCRDPRRAPSPGSQVWQLTPGRSRNGWSPSISAQRGRQPGSHPRPLPASRSRSPTLESPAHGGPKWPIRGHQRQCRGCGEPHRHCHCCPRRRPWQQCSQVQGAPGPGEAEWLIGPSLLHEADLALVPGGQRRSKPLWRTRHVGSSNVTGAPAAAPACGFPLTQAYWTSKRDIGPGMGR